MKLIYISAPYSIGDKVQNVNRAINAGNEILELGFIPFIPHLAHFWDMLTHHPFETWMEIDLEMLSRCDGVLRLPGKSAGADYEEQFALKCDIPVYHSMEEVKNAF